MLVHPALERLVFLLNPKGVKVHRASDGVFDRTATDPLNTTDEPGNRRGPPLLPLKNEAWNRLHLALTGDTIQLLLNDHFLSFTPSDEGAGGISLFAILENSGFTHSTLHRGAMMESRKLN